MTKQAKASQKANARRRFCASALKKKDESQRSEKIRKRSALTQTKQTEMFSRGSGFRQELLLPGDIDTEVICEEASHRTHTFAILGMLSLWHWIRYRNDFAGGFIRNTHFRYPGHDFAIVLSPVQK